MKGSPGGILLIGVGVFVLALGWTGKFAEIWQIFSGNLPGVPKVDLPGPDDIPDQPKGPTTKSCQSDPQCPNGQKCLGGVCVATEKPGENDVCAGGRQLITVISTTEKKCVLPSDLASLEGGYCRPGYVEVSRETSNSSELLCLKTVRQGGQSYAGLITDFPSRFHG